jgi:hypothetical protein
VSDRDPMPAMPPEMAVNLRLLGFSRAAVEYFVSTYHKASPEAWEEWVGRMEREPISLQASIARYNGQYP